VETNPLTVNDEAIADEAFEPTEAELVILNASDREIEAMQAATKLELINRQVMEIAGWENIEIWNPHAIKKSYVGVNLSHPELGIHIPNYVGSIDAIAKVFIDKKIPYHLGYAPLLDEGHFAASGLISSGCTKSPAIALCNLLLAINPPPVTPRRQAEVKIIDDDGEIESQVLEATFG